MEGVDWGPAVAFLVAGVALGALILWRIVAREGAPGRAAAAAGGHDLERRDLEAKLEALVAQLRELEVVADPRAGGSFAERRTLELEAARTLGDLERRIGRPAEGRGAGRLTGDAGVDPAGAPAPGTAAPASSLRGFLWGVGSAAAIGLVLLFVSRSAQERGAGGSLTGSLPGEAAPPADAARDAELAALEDRVRRNPEDEQARLDLARLHLVRQDMMAVFEDTQAVLQRNPRSGRALAYQALVRLAMGQAERAEEMLKRAIEVEPDLLDGYTHLMLVYMRLGRGKDAESVLAAASRHFPEEAQRLQDLHAQLRAQGAEEPAPSGSDDPHAGVPAPGEPAGSPDARAAAPNGPPSRGVAGTLELAEPAQARFVPGSVVFVTLRESGFGAGPPIAARRLVADRFPLAFEIGEGDSMSGEALPDSVLVEARLDGDGDPVTRPRSDPYGSVDRVPIGRTDLRLVLSPRE